jgi:hypothetical protein
MPAHPRLPIDQGSGCAILCTTKHRRLGNPRVLFSIVQDATTAPAQRRKAASEAAPHFLPKNSARGWPGAVADEFGFVISPKMAIEYRDSIFQLQNLSDGGGLKIPAQRHTGNSPASAHAWKAGPNAVNVARDRHRNARSSSEAKNFCGTQKASEDQRFWGIVQR